MSLEGDRDVLEAKADLVEEAFGYLDTVEDRGRGSLESLETTFAVERALLRAVEAALGAANHVVAANGFRRADEYGGLFEVLAEEGVISADLARRLAAMARFRNLLVHRYADVDLDEVWEVVEEDREDVAAFFDALFESVDG